MSDKGTIKIPREDFDRHNERRKDHGQTWAEYIDGEAPGGWDTDALEEMLERTRDAEFVPLDEMGAPEPSIDVDDLTAAVEQAMLNAEVSIGANDPGAPGPSDLAREVARQVDYAELAKRVADELEVRLG